MEAHISKRLRSNRQLALTCMFLLAYHLCPVNTNIVKRCVGKMAAKEAFNKVMTPVESACDNVYKAVDECEACKRHTETPAPTTAAPTTAAPTIAAPTTAAPTTAAPTTAAPTTAAPTTAAPTTAAPTTPAPTTAAPTTAAPTTAAPTEESGHHEGHEIDIDFHHGHKSGESSSSSKSSSSSSSSSSMSSSSSSSSDEGEGEGEGKITIGEDSNGQISISFLTGGESAAASESSSMDAIEAGPATYTLSKSTCGDDMIISFDSHQEVITEAAPAPEEHKIRVETNENGEINIVIDSESEIDKTVEIETSEETPGESSSSSFSSHSSSYSSSEKTSEESKEEASVESSASAEESPADASSEETSEETAESSGSSEESSASSSSLSSSVISSSSSSSSSEESSVSSSSSSTEESGDIESTMEVMTTVVDKLTAAKQALEVEDFNLVLVGKLIAEAGKSYSGLNSELITVILQTQGVDISHDFQFLSSILNSFCEFDSMGMFDSEESTVDCIVQADSLLELCEKYESIYEANIEFETSYETVMLSRRRR